MCCLASAEWANAATARGRPLPAPWGPTLERLQFGDGASLPVGHLEGSEPVPLGTWEIHKTPPQVCAEKDFGSWGVTQPALKLLSRAGGCTSVSRNSQSSFLPNVGPGALPLHGVLTRGFSQTQWGPLGTGEEGSLAIIKC